MCFFVDKKHPNKKIANKDITCYKRLNPYSGRKYKFKSPYRNYKYNLNILFESKIGKIEDYSYGSRISEGLHSYSSKKAALKPVCVNNYIRPGKVIIKGIIPKGSEYYYDSKNKEYVSNQLILIEEIN